MNISYLDAYTLNHGDLSWDNLEKEGVVSIFDFTKPNLIIERAADSEIVIVNKTKLDRSHFEFLPKLKYIIVSATGYNNINIKDAQQFGIKVSNVSGYSTASVSQYVVAALLSHYNRMEYYQYKVGKGAWSKVRDFCFYDHSIEELEGKTAGIIGYGDIGSRVATLLHGFGMNVIVSNKYPDTTDTRIAQNRSVSEVFSDSDVISLHVPLSTQTEGFINARSLALMKENAVLINTSRGGLIVEDELRDHLEKNPSFTAILDVLREEPPPSPHPLVGLSNCLITPHLAWASKQARQRLLDGLIANIQAYKKGNLINKVG